MPVYDFKCHKCGFVDEYVFAKCDEYPDHCGQPMTHFWTEMPRANAVLGGGDLPSYYDPVAGKEVSSTRERKNIMAEHNLICKGGEGRVAKKLNRAPGTAGDPTRTPH